MGIFLVFDEKTIEAGLEKCMADSCHASFFAIICIHEIVRKRGNIIVEQILFMSGIASLYVAILEAITYKRVFPKRVFESIFFSMLVIIQLLLPDNVSEEQISLLLWIGGIFLYLCFANRKNALLYNFSIAMSVVMLQTVCAVLLSVMDTSIWFGLNQIGVILPGKVLLVCMEITFSMILIGCKEKIPLYKWYQNRGIRIISVIIGVIFAILKVIGIHSYDKEQYYFGAAVASVFLFCVLIGIFWLIDHYRLALQKQKAEQDSKRMNANLHRTKELMPLLISVVNENKELLDPEIVEEFQQIYSEQMITERKENMNYKLMGSTGIKLLDAQLQHYILECAKKDITMDVFVAEPIKMKLQELEIAQLMIHNMVGDLLRNAIRAVEKSGIKDGKILVILGIKDRCLECNVYDNGSEIPMEVLQHFGERGVTFGGTGNGLADIVEMLTDYQASLQIKENAPGSSAYIKGFCIIFDGKARRELLTYREMKNESGFWEVCRK